MKVHKYSVEIIGGIEKDDGYVHINHGIQYSIKLNNLSNIRCDSEIKIDGGIVGTWRVEPKKIAIIERPVNDSGRFTFYKIGSKEALSANLDSKNDNLGLISVRFMPEKVITFDENIRFSLEPGGTGLSGKSEQRFKTVPPLIYDTENIVVVHLRLVTEINEPRPLFKMENKIPPKL